MFTYIKHADMLKQIIEKKKQLKQVIYNQNKNKNNQSHHGSPIHDPKISATYSLLSLVTNNVAKFQQFIEKIQSKTHSTISNPYLLMVMLGEYLNLGKIKGGGKLKRIIMDNIHLLPEIKRQTKINKQTVQIRLIQSLKSNNDDSKNFHQLKDLNIQQQSFQKWKLIFEKEKEFQQNQVIQNVFNLSSQQYKEIIKEYPIILKSKIAVIQSFSSALPPFLLLHGVQKSKLENFTVIDACSAPGNKTIQLGEYVHNQLYDRKVYAFEKDPKRFNILNRTVQRYNSQKNIQTFNDNFLSTNPKSQQFTQVKFILLDPSCSGSGMLSNYLRDQNENQTDLNGMAFQQFCKFQYQNLSQEEKQRVQKLHDFQIQLLNHAAKFKPKRISYSTCSIYQRENEDVVGQFLAKNKRYELKENKVISRNIGKFSICEGFGQFNNCVRMDPRKRETDGFFVAIFVKKSSKKAEI